MHVCELWRTMELRMLVWARGMCELQELPSCVVAEISIAHFGFGFFNCSTQADVTRVRQAQCNQQDATEWLVSTPNVREKNHSQSQTAAVKNDYK